MAANAAERAAYLIVLKEQLVAQDLAEAIAEHDPDARVILAHDTAEAMRLLAGQGLKLVLAFLGMAPAALASSGLADPEARVVLIGNEAEETGEGPGWWVLERPFTSDCVRDLLERAGRLSGTAPA
ncbi:hypothetical protein GEU84_015375 [Fertoebacter nigrum]|uniref:Uncharacterized protein n=1 Tax=Fertoeibacter niger TaxID=2656921 RepID=A0A8X8H3Q3_9RHOB|nr:hypothetical protein [Fertoeibacter niger]NUB45779.1 hypothetical protein [Fertoeibacter niger]